MLQDQHTCISISDATTFVFFNIPAFNFRKSSFGWSSSWFIIYVMFCLELPQDENSRYGYMIIVKLFYHCLFSKYISRFPIDFVLSKLIFFLLMLKLITFFLLFLKDRILLILCFFIWNILLFFFYLSSYWRKKKLWLIQ